MDKQAYLGKCHQDNGKADIVTVEVYPSTYVSGIDYKTGKSIWLIPVVEPRVSKGIIKVRE
jgi:hypothetical protein